MPVPAVSLGLATLGSSRGILVRGHQLLFGEEVRVVPRSEDLPSALC